MRQQKFRFLKIKNRFYRLKIQVIDGAIISAAILRAREGIVSMPVAFDILRLRNPAVTSSTPISENLKIVLERGVLLVFVACIESLQHSEANFEPMETKNSLKVSAITQSSEVEESSTQSSVMLLSFEVLPIRLLINDQLFPTSLD